MFGLLARGSRGGLALAAAAATDHLQRQHQFRTRTVAECQKADTATPPLYDYGRPGSAAADAVRGHTQEELNHGPLRIFTGNAHPELARDIAAHMGVPLSKATVGRFKCGEVNVVINESVRDCDVFVIQPTCNGGNGPQENLVELLVMLDAIRRCSPNRVTAVMPLYGYARQNAKEKSRSPITARLVTDLLQIAGAQRVLTIELHAPQIQGFASYPVDNAFALQLLAREIESTFRARGLDPCQDMVVVSPDVGGTKRASSLAKMFDAPLAIFSRQRRRPNEPTEADLVGEVAGKTCVVIDDLADTADTLVKAAVKLKDRGATTVIGAVIHGVFSEPAVDLINGSEMELVIVTDTIPMSEKAALCPKLRVISVAPMLADSILRIHLGKGPNSQKDLQAIDAAESEG